MACGDRGSSGAGTSSAVAEPAPATSASSSASAATAIPPPAPAPATWAVETPAFAKNLRGPSGVFKVGDALVVTSKNRVGKVVGDEIAWLAEVPDNIAFGGTSIVWVGGRSLDELDAISRNGGTGRAPEPTFHPITGKGVAFTVSGGGGWSNVTGVAYTKDSTVIEAHGNSSPSRIVAVRGQPIERFSIPAGSLGCGADFWSGVAVHKEAFGGAKDGTLVGVGIHCKDNKPALEVWPPREPKPQIVRLDGIYEGNPTFLAVLPAGEDALYVVPSGDAPILQVRGDELTPMPVLRGLERVHQGPDGRLYAAARDGIFELRSAKWEPIGSLNWPTAIHTFVELDGTFYISSWGSVGKLVPAASIAMTDACKTPFVSLYDVNADTEPTFTFPATRKALSSFAKASDVQLVEFHETKRRVGVVVPSRAVGDELIAHLAETMPNEKPKLLCYAPRAPRLIALGGK